MTILKSFLLALVATAFLPPAVYIAIATITGDHYLAALGAMSFAGGMIFAIVGWLAGQKTKEPK